MSAGIPPNYYKILEVSETASTSQIRDAYKRAALKTHPDRVPVDSSERATRTRRFQLVNDAYYTLSDASRRKEYDAQRRMFSGSFGGAGRSGNTGTTGGYTDPFEDEDDPDEEIPLGGSGSQNANFNFPSWAWSYFAKSKGQPADAETRQRAQDEQFSDVFEEMLREEGMGANDPSDAQKGKFWSMAGGVSGGVIGFIVANFPGLMAGAMAGNRLGAVRDARGKSVYDVFLELPQAERATLLTQLAAKVFSHTVGI